MCVCVCVGMCVWGGVDVAWVYVCVVSVWGEEMCVWGEEGCDEFLLNVFIFSFQTL